jgi:hypothetical protein
MGKIGDETKSQDENSMKKKRTNCFCHLNWSS